MSKDFRVLIVEDGPYARDLMSLLLTRDWRTRVIAEATGISDLNDFLAQPRQKIDVAIIDTEIPGEPDLPLTMAELVQKMKPSPKIIFTGTLADLNILNYLIRTGNCGYVLKSEVLYSLATAVAFADSGKCVLTPGTRSLTYDMNLPSGTVIIDGRNSMTEFTPRERELIRLGLIFNLSIRDMADELVISRGWVSEVVSGIYQKLGVHDILSGEISPETVFENPAIYEHLQNIAHRTPAQTSDGRLRKAPWMATIAFHLLTIPEIEEL
jgi:DNA-binding NarL/FixJ family response regulator